MKYVVYAIFDDGGKLEAASFASFQEAWKYSDTIWDAFPQVTIEKIS